MSERLRGRDMSPEVLMVGTDALTRGGLSARLRQEGCRVHEVEDGPEALDILRGRDVNVVLLDVRGLGEEALALLRKFRDRYPGTEVVLIIAREHIGLSIKGMRLGAFDDLMAPFEATELMAKVQAAVENRGRKIRAGLGGFPAALRRFVEAVGLTGANMVYGFAPPMDQEGWI